MDITATKRIIEETYREDEKEKGEDNRSTKENTKRYKRDTRISESKGVRPYLIRKIISN